MYLVDTNVWLELILEQERADDVRRFFKSVEPHTLIGLSEFALYSIGISLFRLDKHEAFSNFLFDSIINSGVVTYTLGLEDMQRLALNATNFGLDFDDAYQYTVAEKNDLVLVGFDKHFDRTERGRKEPRLLT
jgi:hypothetical protein